MKTEIEHKYPIGTKLESESGKLYTVVGLRARDGEDCYVLDGKSSDGYSHWTVETVDRRWKYVEPTPNYYVNLYGKYPSDRHLTLGEARRGAAGSPLLVATVAVFDDHFEVVE